MLPADVEPEQRLAGDTKRWHAIALALTRLGRDPFIDLSHPFQRPTLGLLEAGQIVVDLAHHGIMLSCHGRAGVSRGGGSR